MTHPLLGSLAHGLSPIPTPVSKSCPKPHPLLKHSLCLSLPNLHLAFWFLHFTVSKTNFSLDLTLASPNLINIAPSQHLCLGIARRSLLRQRARCLCYSSRYLALLHGLYIPTACSLLFFFFFFACFLVLRCLSHSQCGQISDLWMRKVSFTT